MKKYFLLLILLVLVATGAVLALAQGGEGETEAKIESAMSAAPTNIAEDATILDWAFDEEGKFLVLREGTNGWNCLPASPKPMCLDAVFMDWLYAVMTGGEFNVTSVGFAYLLQGGVALSNSNPGAMEPAEDHWMSDAPYMMVILPTGVALDEYSSDPENPIFIMYADTPYQHLMIPLGDVQTTEDEQ
jgi:hypothetical protein